MHSHFPISPLNRNASPSYIQFSAQNIRCLSLSSPNLPPKPAIRRWSPVSLTRFMRPCTSRQRTNVSIGITSRLRTLSSVAIGPTSFSPNHRRLGTFRSTLIATHPSATPCWPPVVFALCGASNSTSASWNPRSFWIVKYQTSRNVLTRGSA